MADERARHGGAPAPLPFTEPFTYEFMYALKDKPQCRRLPEGLLQPQLLKTAPPLEIKGKVWQLESSANRGAPPSQSRQFTRFKVPRPGFLSSVREKPMQRPGDEDIEWDVDEDLDWDDDEAEPFELSTKDVLHQQPQTAAPPPPPGLDPPDSPKVIGPPPGLDDPSIVMAEDEEQEKVVVPPVQAGSALLSMLKKQQTPVQQQQQQGALDKAMGHALPPGAHPAVPELVDDAALMPQEPAPPPRVKCTLPFVPTAALLAMPHEVCEQVLEEPAFPDHDSVDRFFESPGTRSFVGVEKENGAEGQPKFFDVKFLRDLQEAAMARAQREAIELQQQQQQQQKQQQAAPHSPQVAPQGQRPPQQQAVPGILPSHAQYAQHHHHHGHPQHAPQSPYMHQRQHQPQHSRPQQQQQPPTQQQQQQQQQQHAMSRPPFPPGAMGNGTGGGGMYNMRHAMPAGMHAGMRAPVASRYFNMRAPPQLQQRQPQPQPQQPQQQWQQQPQQQYY